MGGLTAVVLEGVQPWDGTYDLGDFQFTNRELHRIKEISGLRAGELIDGLEQNDTGAYVGIAVVALARQGKQVAPDVLWDANVGSIRLLLEDDADPPTTPASGPSSSGNSGSSGDDFATAGV